MKRSTGALDSHSTTAPEGADLAQSDVEIGLALDFPTAEKIILAAIKCRASDVHVMPGNGNGRISIRTDGIVSTLIPKIPAARMENLANAFSDWPA